MDRIDQAKSLISEALDRLEALPEDHREAAPELDDLRRQLDYALVVIEKTDPTLVPSSAWDSLDAVPTRIRDQADPAALVQQVASHRTNLGTALSQLPVARGRLGEQRLAGILAEGQDRVQAKIDEL